MKEQETSFQISALHVLDGVLCYMSDYPSRGRFLGNVEDLPVMQTWCTKALGRYYDFTFSSYAMSYALRYDFCTTEESADKYRDDAISYLKALSLYFDKLYEILYDYNPKITSVSFEPHSSIEKAALAPFWWFVQHTPALNSLMEDT